ncbi:DUF535 domain-containing protein [Muribacter muris]|uniref:DUF535 domain-containing protein n=1 Tax=Muribacter muris TaxID=67855 RepID=A0A4Y9JPD5_9PAST|nr:DUF535 family protein [Muribacter muris]MBF0786191.1 DUF535 family protein [Muribacter muris]MBF0826260.1 DUF535 family protein [Muribacter muris]TFV07663.1 DUF535 domain-containing protein [Muribacter muris]
MPQNLYHWPDPHALYPDRPPKSYRWKRLRYRLRAMLNAKKITQFTACVNQNPALAQLLNANPSYSYPLVHRFLDKRFSASQRLHAIYDNLTFLPPTLWHKTHYLGEIVPDFSLYLNLNQQQAMEGYWSLELRYNQTDQLVYLLTFGKIEDALLIAVIQGPNFEGSKELVKLLTKKCHGLRPAYLMVEAMKALTNVLGYQKLWGIPQKYQNKSRFIQSKRYVVDYDRIFAESMATHAKYWELPRHFETKAIEDIPSNKRAMYRKRYAMLNALQQTMAEKLVPHLTQAVG